MGTNFEELIVTSEPSYYKWSQWLFNKMVEHDMAYKKYSPVNYCPSCKKRLRFEEIDIGAIRVNTYCKGHPIRIYCCNVCGIMKAKKGG